jgi:hypothetical protein
MLLRTNDITLLYYCIYIYLQITLHINNIKWKPFTMCAKHWKQQNNFIVQSQFSFDKNHNENIINELPLK